MFKFRLCNNEPNDDHTTWFWERANCPYMKRASKPSPTLLTVIFSIPLGHRLASLFLFVISSTMCFNQGLDIALPSCRVVFNAITNVRPFTTWPTEMAESGWGTKWLTSTDVYCADWRVFMKFRPCCASPCPEGRDQGTRWTSWWPGRRTQISAGSRRDSHLQKSGTTVR